MLPCSCSPHLASHRSARPSFKVYFESHLLSPRLQCHPGPAHQCFSPLDDSCAFAQTDPLLLPLSPQTVLKRTARLIVSPCRSHQLVSAQVRQGLPTSLPDSHQSKAPNALFPAPQAASLFLEAFINRFSLPWFCLEVFSQLSAWLTSFLSLFTCHLISRAFHNLPTLKLNSHHPTLPLYVFLFSMAIIIYFHVFSPTSIKNSLHAWAIVFLVYCF